MKQSFALISIIVVVFALSACEKSDSGALTSSTYNAKQVSAISQIQAGSSVRSSLYPYCDTFYGPYSEYSSDLIPNSVSGFSTVYVWHLTADSINVQADSIGLALYSGQYNTYINLYPKFNSTYPDSFAINVQWYSDRYALYTCKLYADSLCCVIMQQGGICASEYDGNYTGYIKRGRR